MTNRTANLWLSVAILLWAVSPLLVQADEAAFAPEQIEFFEKEVRPLLVEHCQKCHSSEKQKGELRLDSREALLKGGDTGPAIVPGNPDESELIKALLYDPDGYQMPPEGKLSPETIAVFVKWVELGAPWPAEAGGKADKLAPASAEEFARRAERWSFQPLQRVTPPVVKETSWARTPIDRFLLAKLEQAGLTPAPETDRRTWIRRVYFDTIGLPPTPEAVAAFVSNESPDAFEAVVDELLASPRFGERWGRHWLDLARYAESRGHEFDADVPNPWHYRDYVIRAFNDDLPYDRFVTEHMAGDLMEEAKRRVNAHELHPVGMPAPPQPSTLNAQRSPLLATGFWYLGEWVHSPVDIRKDETDRIDNMIEVYGKTFLGLTISCARCHDHKFDPISHKDYYALAGYIKSTSYAQRPFETLEHNRRIKKELRDLASRAEKPVLDAMLHQTWGSLSNLDKILLTAKAVISAADGRKELFAGFESGEYGEWQSTGDAFGEGPQSALTIGTHQGDVKPQGTYFVNSHQSRDGGRGDDHVGRLLSPKFAVVHDALSFLVGGGDHEGKTCVNLLIDGQVVLSATGRNANEMASVTWDLKPFDKRTAQIEIVDEERGRWGNIGVDHFVFEDERTKTRPSDEELMADLAVIHEVDETLLRHWVKHLRHAATDPLDPFHEWARYAVGATLSYDEVIARMGQRAKQYRDQFGFLDSDPPYLRSPSNNKWQAILEEKRREASDTALVTPPKDVEPEPKTDVIAILSQDGTSFSLPNDEYTPSTEKSLFSDPDYVEEYWTQSKERYWLSDDPAHPIAAVASQHESRVDPDFAEQRSADGTMTDGGSLAPLQRSGRTLRTASFEITKGKLFAWMRGGAATYVVVDSHSLVLGPLHGSLVRKQPAEDRWRWVEHDVSRYVGHQAHLEFVPESNSHFAVSRVLQRSTAPANDTVFGASADLLNEFEGFVNFMGCSQTPGFQATEASVAGAFKFYLFFPSYQLRHYMQSHPELFALDSPEFQKELVQIAKPFMDERQKLVAQIRPTSAVAPAMLEGSSADEYLLIRGNSSKPGPVVPRRFIQVFHGHGPDANEPGSGRLDLARQMTDPTQTPLVPRVIANRIWHHYFGRGIVASTDDFGHMGQLPTHPELLDWLATELVQDEWSQKQVHRVILLSAAYRMGSEEAERPETSDESQAAGSQPSSSVVQPSSLNPQPSPPDPNNLLLHRMNIKRLEGEIIRDALFSLSGREDDRMYGPSVPIALNDFQDGRGKPTSGPIDGAGRRSLYLSVRRNFLESFMTVFDMPNPHTSVGRRSVSNVPAQALALLNSPMVLEQVQRWGARLCHETPQLSSRERIDRLYQLAFSRPSTPEELESALVFIEATARDRGVPVANPQNWGDLCHVLLNAKEFIYIR